MYQPLHKSTEKMVSLIQCGVLAVVSFIVVS